MTSRVELDGLRLAMDIYDRVDRGDELLETTLLAYYESQAIQFVCAHLKYWSQWTLDYKTFKEIVIKGLSGQASDSVLVKSVHQGYSYYKRYNHLLDRVFFLDLLEEARLKAGAYLPCEPSEDMVLYPLLGIRGTGLVLDNRIGLDLIDDSLLVDGRVCRQRMVALLAHEVHHIESERLGRQAVEKMEGNKLKLEMLTELLSEGTAMYYLTNPEEVASLKTEVWQRNMENIEVHVQEVIDCIEAGDSQKRLGLYNGSMVGYCVGYHMVERIHRILGKEGVMACILNPALFIDHYQESCLY